MNSRREQYAKDTQTEQLAASFLDSNFWSKFPSDKARAFRWKDVQHQFDGIDVSLSCTSGVWNFDEKCKTYGCLNQQLDVLSFELSFVNKRGAVQDGWFAAKNKTDYLMFIQLSAKVDDAKLLKSESDITAADILWIKKHDVEDLVEQFTTMEQLKEDAKELREDEIASLEAAASGKCRKTYKHRKYWLTYSTRMHEKPVNLVVSRETLESLPHTKHMVAAQRGVKVI